MRDAFCGVGFGLPSSLSMKTSPLLEVVSDGVVGAPLATPRKTDDSADTPSTINSSSASASENKAEWMILRENDDGAKDVHVGTETVPMRRNSARERFMR